MKQFLCGVPDDQCNGSYRIVNARMRVVRGRDSVKLHSSPEDAFTCYRRYLLAIGYKQIGSREFETPSGSILVLNKKSHFGATLRPGKTGTTGNKSKRYIPEAKRSCVIT